MIFFVLILIKFKLITFPIPIGNVKVIFESNIKSIFVKEFQNIFNIASSDEELTETKDSIPIIPEKSGIYAKDFFALLLKQNENPNWAYSSQLCSYQQFYRLYSNFCL